MSSRQLVALLLLASACTGAEPADDEPVESSDAGAAVTIPKNHRPSPRGGPFTVLERSQPGTVVGTIVVEDADEGQGHFFSFASGNRGQAFDIDAQTGVITVAHSNPLDFEGWPYFTLVVRVTDDGIPRETGTVSVDVTVHDANDAPSIGGGPFSVAENSNLGTVVGRITVTDQDEGQSYGFAITDGNTDGAFSIDTSGTIKVARRAPLDFESGAAFALTITATDNGTPRLSATHVVDIALTDANEAPAGGNASFQLVEHSPPETVVGQVPVDDPDAEQAHTFTLVLGNDGDTFAVREDGSLVVVNNALLDVAQRTSFSLTVHVFDDATPPLAGEANIVVDVVPAPD